MKATIDANAGELAVAQVKMDNPSFTKTIRREIKNDKTAFVACVILSFILLSTFIAPLVH